MCPLPPPAPPPSGLTVLQVLPALKDGGVEQSALEMAAYLTRHDARALVASAGGPLLKDLVKTNACHFTLPLNRKDPVSVLANAASLYRVIRREGVQLVHARSRAPAWSAWIACKLSGVPYVTTFHGTYGLGGGALKRFYNSVMLKGPVVIANSQFIKAHIIEKYGVDPARIVVASRGVNPDVFDPALFTKKDRDGLHAEWKVGKNEPVLMMVGRLTRWKGQDVLLRALAQCTDLPWKLILVGASDKGGFEQELSALVDQLGLRRRVVFAGSRRDIPRLLHAADLAFSCSTQPEAFGRVAIEAMAMQVPVIASVLGGSLETVVDGKTGWLVAPAAPQALAESIHHALRAPARLATMGHTARSHVLAHFTVDQCCAAETDAYTRTLRAQNGD